MTNEMTIKSISVGNSAAAAAAAADHHHRRSINSHGNSSSSNSSSSGRSSDAEDEDYGGSSAKEKPPFYTWQWHRVNGEEFPSVCDLCGHRCGGGGGGTGGGDDDESLKAHQLRAHFNPRRLSPSDRASLMLADLSGAADLRLYRCGSCRVSYETRGDLKDHLRSNKTACSVARKPPPSSSVSVAESLLGIDDDDVPLKRFRKTPRSSPQKEKQPVSSSVESTPDTEKSNSEEVTSPQSNQRESEATTEASDVKRLGKESILLEHSEPIASSAPISNSSNQSTEPPKLPSRPERRSKSEANALVAISLEQESLDFDYDDDEDTKPLKSNDKPKETNDVKIEIPSKRGRPKSIVKGALKRKKKKRLKLCRVKGGKTKEIIREQKLALSKSETARSRGRPRKMDAAAGPKTSKIRPQRTGFRETKRSLGEKERTASIVEAVTRPERRFVCLETLQTYHDYNALISDRRRGKKSISKDLKVKETSDIFNEPCPRDFSNYISTAAQVIPANIWNNMHGKLVHLQQPVVGRLKAVDKVKMNLSGEWTTKEVWEACGVEMGPEGVLSWQRYENETKEPRFLQRLSSMPMCVQTKFKQVFDARVARDVSRSSSDSEDVASTKRDRRMKAFFKGLELRQTLKSNKSSSELSSKSLTLGTLGGEWELDHDFACTACNATYDDFREALHHKWDAHPYALISHVVLPKDIQLPPSGFLHPQLGRSLARIPPPGALADLEHAQVRRRSQQRALVKSLLGGGEMICSKCPDEKFEYVGDYHAHLLACGGDDSLLDTRKLKKNRKRKSSIDGQQMNNSAKKKDTPEVAAAKRRARMEKFLKPPPTVAETGRMTRHQANILNVDEEKTVKKRVKKKKSKPAEESAKPTKRIVLKRKSEDKQLTLPERSRRSTVNYARDAGLREAGGASTPEAISKLMEHVEDELHDETTVEDQVEEEQNENGNHNEIVPRKRSRRSASSTSVESLLLNGNVANLGRSFFPLDFKLAAVKRIADGELSQAELARELQVPLSTLAGWWQKREQLEEKQRKFEEDINRPKSPTFPPTPRYEKNSLLQTMRSRVEKAFEANETNQGVTQRHLDEIRAWKEDIPSPEPPRTEAHRPESSCSSSAGLSLIFDNYGGESGDEVWDADDAS